MICWYDIVYSTSGDEWSVASEIYGVEYSESACRCVVYVVCILRVMLCRRCLC